MDDKKRQEEFKGTIADAAKLVPQADEIKGDEDSVFDEPTRGDADDFRGTLVMTRQIPNHRADEDANDRTLQDVSPEIASSVPAPSAQPVVPNSVTIELHKFGTVDTLNGFRESALNPVVSPGAGKEGTGGGGDAASPVANPGGATIVLDSANPMLRPRAGTGGEANSQTFVDSPKSSGAGQAGAAKGGADPIQQTIAMMWDEAIKEDDGPPTRTIKGTSRPNISDTQLVIQTRNVVNRKMRYDGTEVGAEYELLKELGKGGVGVVWLARQASIDRNVAIKMLRPDRVTEAGNREKFLAEAVVTGDLDHPNIVPIYDLGADSRGTLFYSMKRVQGTPWNDVVREKTLQENLEILLKVADAVGFAHSRGIIHRDLKPENVMLGDFGEVLVMDWGIALPLAEYSKSGEIMRAQQGLGGSPAYMAPEMVLGPIEILAPPTDVYLLGAILFEILVGKPPHTGKNIYQCLNSAARNEIIDTDKTGELIDIARCAMSTEMQDRYPTVRDFQNAIREYQAHEKSIVMAERAKEDLQRAHDTQSYEDYARSVFAFQEAVALWGGNEEAAAGVVDAKFAYAQGALKKGDFDLGLTLVDPAIAAHKPVYTELTRARDERNSRQARLARFKQIIAALLVLVSAGGVVGTIAIYAQKQLAVAEREKAFVAREEAKESEKKAIAAQAEEAKAKEAALKLRDDAETARIEEEKAKKDAIRLKVKAEYAQKKEEFAKQEAIAEKLKAQEAQKKEETAKKDAIAEKLKAQEAQKKEESAKKEAIAEKLRAEEAQKKEETAKKEAIAQKLKAEDAQKKEADAKLVALLAAKKEAEAKEEAVKQKENAITASRIAQAARDAAQAARDNADKARAQETIGRRLAEEQSYWAQVGLVNSKLRANQFAEANDILVNQENSPLRRLRHWEWARQNYLSSAKSSGLSALAERVMNLPGQVQTLAVSPRETWFAYAARDVVKVVDVKSGEELASLAFSGKGNITALSISSDERYLAVGGESLDADVVIWQKGENATWKELAAIKHPGSASKYAPQVRSVGGIVFVPGAAQSPSLVTFVSNRSDLYHWTYLPGGAGSGGAGAANAAAKSPWQQKLLRGHFDRVQSARLVPGKAQLVSASDDGSIRRWDLEQGTEILPRFVGHKGAVYDAAISPDGAWLASAGYDKRVLLWSLASVASLPQAPERTVVRFPQDDSTKGPKIVAWELTGHQESVRRVMFMQNPKPTEVAEGAENAGRAAAVKPDDSLFLVSSSDDNTAIVWYAQRAMKLATQRASQAAPGAGAPGAPAPTDAKEFTPQQLVRNVLRGHGSPLQQCLVGNDGLTVIAGTTGLGWRSWNIKSYEEVRQFGDLEKIVVVAAKVLPDGKRLVTALQDGNTVLWDIESGRQIARFEDGHAFLTNTAQFLPSGTQAITAAGDGTTCLWDLVHGVQKYRLAGTGNRGIFAISADGNRLLTGSERRTALLWDVGSATQLAELDPYGELVNRFRQGSKGATEGSYRRQLPEVTALAISDNASLMLTGDSEGFLKLWDGSGKVIETFAAGHSEPVVYAAFLPQTPWAVERQWLAISAGADGLENVWKKNGSRDQAASFVKGGPITSCALSADGRRLVYSVNQIVDDQPVAPAGKGTAASVVTTAPSSFSSVVVRNLQTAQESAWAKRIRGSVNQVRFYEENDSALLVTTSEETRSGTRQVLTCYREGKPVEGGVLREASPWAAAGSPNARQLLMVSGKEARLYDVLKQNENTSFKLNTSLRRHGKVNAVDVSPDGKLLVTAGSEGLIKLWDVDTHKALHQFKDGHQAESEIFSAVFSPDGKYLVTSAADGKLCLWNVPQRKLVPWAGEVVKNGGAGERGALSPIRFVQFSPDGHHLLVSSDTANATIYQVRWQAETLQLLQPRPVMLKTEDEERNTIGLSAAAFSPDGQHLLTVSNPTIGRGGGTVQAWSLNTQGNWQSRGQAMGESITTVAFSADGLRALMGDLSGRVSLVDIRGLSLPIEATEDGIEIREVMELTRYELASRKADAAQGNRHQRRISFVAFSPNGRDVITASEDGTSLLWLGQSLPPAVELSAEETMMSETEPSNRIDGKLRVSYPTARLPEDTLIVVTVEPDNQTDEVAGAARAIDAGGGNGNGNGDVAPRGAKSEVTVDYSPDQNRSRDVPQPQWQINEQGQVVINVAGAAGPTSAVVGKVERQSLGSKGERFTILLQKDAPSYLMQDLLRSLKVKWDADRPVDSKTYSASIDIVPSALANQRTIRNPNTIERRKISYRVENK